MAESPDLPPSDDELAAWIRRHPEVWPPDERGDIADRDGVDARVAAMVDAIVAEGRAIGRSRRRRSRMFVAAGAVVTIGVGTAGVAAFVRSGQPEAPEAGASCRAEASLETDTVMVLPGIDPIEGCREEWEYGAFADRVGPEGVPPLVACTGVSGGTINVFPGGANVCEQLGLVPADPELDADSHAVIDLQARLIDEINVADCQAAAVVAEQVEEILAKSGLAGWRVAVLADPTTSVCAKTGVDSATRTVNVIELEGHRPP